MQIGCQFGFLTDDPRQVGSVSSVESRVTENNFGIIWNPGIWNLDPYVDQSHINVVAMKQLRYQPLSTLFLQVLGHPSSVIRHFINEPPVSRR
jgi:hypothetical protein